MKRMIIAAGALLMGTSALAYAGSMDKSATQPTAASSDVKLTGADKLMVPDESILSAFDKARVTTWEKTFASSKSDVATSDSAKLDTAALDKDLAPLAADETGAKLMTASAETGWTDSGKADMAWTADSLGTKVHTASLDKAATAETGMGGPLEEVDATATPMVVQPSNASPERDARGIPVISDVAFVPPGYNGTTGGVGGPIEGGDNTAYPACTRTQTDNCIQLYERGVTGAGN